MDPFDPYPFFHGFHVFGGLLMLGIGILIGRGAMRRRMLRRGVDPALVYGGCASRRREAVRPAGAEPAGSGPDQPAG